jgi:hypothetical protein
MGAWDFGPFDNDDAHDWLYDLEKSSDISVIASVLRKITDIGDEYLEAPDCSSAVAGAEVIAAIRGQPIAKFPDNAKLWVESHCTLDVTNLIPNAIAALQRIRTNSELKELWDESEAAPKWYATIDDLTHRLKNNLTPSI